MPTVVVISLKLDKQNNQRDKKYSRKDDELS